MSGVDAPSSMSAPGVGEGGGGGGGEGEGALLNTTVNNTQLHVFTAHIH